MINIIIRFIGLTAAPGAFIDQSDLYREKEVVAWPFFNPCDHFRTLNM